MLLLRRKTKSQKRKRINTRILRKISWLVTDPAQNAEVFQKRKGEVEIVSMTENLRKTVVLPNAVTVACPVSRYGEKHVDLQLQGSVSQILQRIHQLYKRKKAKMGDLVFFEGIEKMGNGYVLLLGS